MDNPQAETEEISQADLFAAERTAQETAHDPDPAEYAYRGRDASEWPHDLAAD